MCNLVLGVFSVLVFIYGCLLLAVYATRDKGD